ncbi:MAG TPA: alanyl-tRNA editing protein [Thermomicrobiaceae bacterium]|nr:alanyl-tRNA editing protein [Thermomicrobiaceae bacterium]
MTKLLFLDDSYIREFDATVTGHAGENGITLDRTAFYAGGGGQPNDVGKISDGEHTWQVTKVGKVDGEVVHTLEGDELPEVGAKVHGVVDWDRRYKLMRTHTALHILCGVIFQEYGAQVTGANMDVDHARMDFELEDLNSERVAHIQTIINDKVQEDLPISWRTLPREEAFQIPDLIRTKINLLPAGIQEVRVLEIHGLDLQADGGTHVRNTREVGGIAITGTRSKGRINKRLTIEVRDEPVETAG